MKQIIWRMTAVAVLAGLPATALAQDGGSLYVADIIEALDYLSEPGRTLQAQAELRKTLDALEAHIGEELAAEFMEWFDHWLDDPFPYGGYDYTAWQITAEEQKKIEIALVEQEPVVLAGVYSGDRELYLDSGKLSHISSLLDLSDKELAQVVKDADAYLAGL